MGFLNGLFSGMGKGCGGCGEGSSLLFFFLLLVVLFCNCGMFDECGDSLLFFFLLLVVLMCGCGDDKCKCSPKC